MCCQCGEIVQNRLDKGHALPCGKGHLAPATIARASLVKPRQPMPAAPAVKGSGFFFHQVERHGRNVGSLTTVHESPLGNGEMHAGASHMG
jgi:hypothetical protein